MPLSPPSQQRFLEATRRAVDANPKQFFLDNDWKCIKPKSGTYIGLQPNSLGSQSYNAFETEWNNEVGRRYGRHLQGDELIVLIHCKSAEYLKEYHKYVVELQQQSTMVMQRNDPIRKRLNHTLRQTRNAMQVVPPVAIQNQPVQYPAGYAPIGTPATFNAPLIAPALIHRQSGNQHPSPWILGVLNRPTHNPLEGFRSTMWCLKCGDRRRNHAQWERFGSRCKRCYCAKCGWTKEHHKDEMMGPYCINPRQHGSPDNKWYHQT